MAAISTWPEGERPRERILRLGAQVLSDGELLAVLIGTGSRTADALAVARALLTAQGGLAGLAGATGEGIRKVRGIGPAKSARLLAAMEIGRRLRVRAVLPGRPIRSSADVFLAHGPFVDDLKREVFHILLLDARHRVVREVQVSEGTLTSSLVHPREVFRPAIIHAARAVIAFHNHPSGDPEPSGEDRELTRRLEETGRILGIPLLDHLVIGRNGYFSFRDEGLMGPGEVSVDTGLGS